MKAPEERFWGKVTKQSGDGCWEWQAALSQGYGRFRVGGRGSSTRVAHLVLWEWERGPVSEGLELDHLCRNRRCVRPEHLEPVSHRENLVRSPITMTGIHVVAVICPQGHAYDATNTYHRKDRPGRECRACQRQRNAEWRSRQLN